MKNESFYTLEKKDIVLYGAATMGCIYYEKIYKIGFNIIGFIDQRGKEIKEIYGLPVFSLENAEFSKDVVIFIAVKNVFEHTKIANELVEKGYTNIIFRPYNCLIGQGTDEEKQINKMYDLFSEGKICEYHFKYIIPKVKILFAPKLKNDAILKEQDDYLTILIPITLLFTDKKIGSDGKESNEIPILLLKPHIEFVKCVLGVGDYNVQSYLAYCEEAAKKIDRFKVTPAWRANVIRNRAEVFNNMNHLYNVNKQYFVNNAPFVQWNEKGYFNLCSGKHRSTFLMTKGDNYIPVKMLKNDYLKWTREREIQKIQTYINSIGINYIQAPVENPFFYNLSCPNEQFFYELIRGIAQYLSDFYYVNSSINIMEGKKIFISMEDGGFCKRFFRRCGCKVYCNSKKDNFYDLINGLFEEKLYIEEKYALYDVAIIYEENDIEKIQAKIVFKITKKREEFNHLFSGIYNGKLVNVYGKKYDNI